MQNLILTANLLYVPKNIHEVYMCMAFPESSAQDMQTVSSLRQFRAAYDAQKGSKLI